MEINTDRAQWEEHLSAYFTDSIGEIGGDFDFTIMCNTKRLIVTVSPSPEPNDKLRLLLSRYGGEDPDNEDQAREEIIDMIFDAGWRIFAQLAPSPENRVARFPANLYSDLYPETFYLHLTMVGGTAQILQESAPQHQDWHFHLTTVNGFDWPKYPARNIVVTQKLMGSGYIAKVSVDGRDMCCKIGTRTACDAVQREYECLQKIAMTAGASSIRVPRFVGFVVDDDGIAIGILEEFIPHEFTLGRVIKGGGVAVVSHEQRAKWAQQIQRTVEQLHEIGVVWGDGKPDNVLVHTETDDCWLVDFGGSWTDGWVDAALKETRAGDTQAVVKIMDFVASS